MSARPFLMFVSAATVWLAGTTIHAELLGSGVERRNAQLDFNRDGFLDYDELIFGLTLQLTGKGDILAAQKTGRAPSAPKPDNLDPTVFSGFMDVSKREVLATGSTMAAPRWPLGVIPPEEVGTKNFVLPAPTDAELAKKRYLTDFNWKLRRSQEDLDKDIEDRFGQGALFSYSYDYNLNEDQWAARGVLGFDYSVTRNKDYKPETEIENGKSTPSGSASSFSDDAYLRWAKYGLIVDFNKVTTGGSARDEVDSLNFLASARFSWKLPFGKIVGLTGMGLDVGAHYTTDFDFEKRLLTATVDIKPRTNIWGHGKILDIGTTRDRFGRERALVRLRWSVSIHGEAGTVEEAGSAPGRLLYDDFQRVGGSGDLELFLLPAFFDDRLSLTASYQHYEAQDRIVPSTHLFKASAQYLFATGSGVFAIKKDKEGDATPTMTEREVLWTLRLEYTNGTTPLVAQDDNHLLLGLGIVF